MGIERTNDMGVVVEKSKPVSDPVQVEKSVSAVKSAGKKKPSVTDRVLGRKGGKKK